MRYSLENKRQAVLTPNSGTTSMKPTVGRGPKGEDGANVLPTDTAVENALANRGLPTSGGDLADMFVPQETGAPGQVYGVDVDGTTPKLLSNQIPYVSQVAPTTPTAGLVWLRPRIFDPAAWTIWGEKHWAQEMELADGSKVAQWNDTSAAATMHLTQATDAQRPVFHKALPIFNYRSAVQFDAANNTKMQTPTLATGINHPQTIVMIANAASVTMTLFDGVAGAVHRLTRTTGGEWEIRSSASVFLDEPAPTADGLAHLFIATFNSPNGGVDETQLEVDGVLKVGPGDASSQQFKAFTLGQTYDGLRPLTGGAAFLGRVDRLLTSQEKADLLIASRAYYGTP